VTTIGSTAEGLALLGSLGITPGIEATILVPTNVAFTGVGEEVTGNVSLMRRDRERKRDELGVMFADLLPSFLLPLPSSP